MEDPSSITRHIAGLKRGEADDMQRLWERYSERLTELARQRLQGHSKRTADEEDIALSVFYALCRGAEAGRLDQITGRDDLWWLLLSITHKKIVDHVRREMAEKRGGGRLYTETDLRSRDGGSSGFTLDSLIGSEPTPEFLLALEEEHQRLIGLLDDERMKKIANARIEGYTVAEVAAELQISRRGVERKLQLIRDRWAQEVSDAGKPDEQ